MYVFPDTEWDVLTESVECKKKRKALVTVNKKGRRITSVCKGLSLMWLKLSTTYTWHLIS